jgi:D-arabinose 1-dehydrogenase-like Zn-dependent alcohol dehydrogenase
MYFYCFFCATVKCALVASTIRQRFGMTAFSPRIIQRKWIKGACFEEEKPYLPGYVFVCSEAPIENFVEIRMMEGVIRCLGQRDEGYRLQVAAELACYDRFINVQREDAAAIIMEETGIGADLVVEASGAGSAIRTAIQVLKKWGTLCAIGMTGAPTVEVPWNQAMMKVLDVQFNMSSSYHGWDMALKLMASGRVKVAPMIGVRLLTEWEQAFADLEAGKAMKLLLKPTSF